MVRFHMLHHQIIGRSAAQSALDVVYPFVSEMLVHSIHNCNFIVQYNVGVVRHTVGNNVLPFKQIDVTVVYADV